MSSLVQAKWTNSLAWARASSLPMRSLMKYSTALTSWLVVRLDFLDALAVVDAEVLGDGLEPGGFGGAEGRQLDDARMRRQGQQPADFDQYAPVHQPEFAENRTQRSGLGGVAAVQRREGGQRGVGHGAWVPGN